jgi:hypothetical protein
MIGTSVGLGVAFFIILSGIVSLLYHRRHGSVHVPVAAQTPAIKYEMHGRERGAEVNTAVFELHSPDGEKKGGTEIR